jgi:hypothetical protein
MAKYNKLMREKTKYDSEVKSAKASCDSYSQNLGRFCRFLEIPDVGSILEMLHFWTTVHLKWVLTENSL